MKKALSLILSIALVLTLFTAIPVSAATEADDYKVTATDFVCGPYDRGEWGSLLKASTVDTGAKLEFLVNHSTQVSMAYATPVDLNGAHFKLTLEDNTDGRYTGVWINNSTANDPGSKGIFIKSTNNGERQFQIGNKGFGDSNAINHSGYEYCYPGLADRLHLPENLISASINEYEYRFAKNLDGSFTLTFNGYDIVISAADMAVAGIDTENVYIHFCAYGTTTDFTVNYVHGGGEDCADLVADIDTKAATATAKEMVNLYAKAQALSAEGKAKIAQYPNLVSAVYGMTDAEYYKLVQTDLRGYSWWGTTSAIADGVNMNFGGGLPYVYSHAIEKKVIVDDLTLEYIRNSGYEYALILDNDTLNPNGTSDNNISMKMNNEGKIYITLNGTAVTAENLKYGSLDSNGWVPASIMSDNKEFVIRFDVENDGALSMYINNTKIYTLNAAAVTSCGLPLNGAYVKFAALGYDFNIDLHYLRSGNEPTFAEITDSRYYKVTASDIKDHGWGNITKTETDDGYNIKYLTNYPYIYTQWVDKAVNVDGLKFAYTINSSSYYSRIMNVGLASSGASNPERANTPLDIQLESGWIRVWINGTAITSADYSYAAFDTTNKIIPCGDIVNGSVNRYEFSFDFEDNGGLTIYINGNKMVTLSAAQVASAGLDFSYARLKFAPAEGYPGGQTEFIDYTVHYIKDGSFVSQVRTEKPVKVAGDANADMNVDILDFIRIKKHIGDASFPIFTQAADLAVNEDASVVIGVEDLAAEKQLLLFQ